MKPGTEPSRGKRWLLSNGTDVIGAIGRKRSPLWSTLGCCSLGKMESFRQSDSKMERKEQKRWHDQPERLGFLGFWGWKIETLFRVMLCFRWYDYVRGVRFYFLFLVGFRSYFFNGWNSIVSSGERNPPRYQFSQAKWPSDCESSTSSGRSVERRNMKIWLIWIPLWLFVCNHVQQVGVIALRSGGYLLLEC